MKKISIILAFILNGLLAFSQVTYQYDHLNRLQKVAYANGITVDYTYDELGNRTKKTVVGIALSNDATLKSLSVSAGTLSFDAHTITYTVNVANSVTAIDVIGTANHANATVNGNVIGKALEIGDNVVEITVTAEDGTIKTYTVTIIRAGSIAESEANLAGITVNGNEITVAGNTIEYAALCGEASLALDLQVSPNSTVTVNGVEHEAGQSIDLTDDLTVADIQVTAGIGGVVSNYTLNINAPLNDSRLYYQRWDDVLAINLNPATNGGYHISETRWYRQDGTPAGDGGYIVIRQGTVSDYYAEVRADEKLRNVCPVPETRVMDKIVVYPNPVPRGGSLQLTLPETFVGGVLNIYDIKGSIRKSGLPLPTIVNSIHVSDMDSGIYLMHFFSRDGSRQEIKLIID
ncbi:MAG: cadherin-like beta sandwich domain-containing protein [Bacteroidales bacterium]|nr:cadherin-like beta sandwich domain-containing protein [Bacteroidales bacterium]